MFSENCENFSFEDCAFMVHKSKESCGRIVMWREFNLVNSYTCEASFCGPTRGIHNGCHFNIFINKVSTWSNPHPYGGHDFWGAIIAAGTMDIIS